MADNAQTDMQTKTDENIDLMSQDVADDEREDLQRLMAEDGEEEGGSSEGSEEA